MTVMKTFASASVMARKPAHAEMTAEPRAPTNVIEVAHGKCTSSGDARALARRISRTIPLSARDDDAEAVRVPELDDHATSAR